MYICKNNKKMVLNKRRNFLVIGPLPPFFSYLKREKIFCIKICLFLATIQKEITFTKK